jgi:murein DD-endopeptidase MepM/ murein hydrolase activator NlpD
MGQKLFHLVSPVNGVIVDLRGPGQGYSDHSIRIMGDRGWFYAFLHMNDDNPGTDDGAAPGNLVFAPGLAVGTRVQAGQFIGYMGDSGNAEGSGPHLHFEMRQPAGNLWDAPAIDPYPSLMSARRCPDPLAPPPPPPFEPPMAGAHFL